MWISNGQSQNAVKDEWTGAHEPRNPRKRSVQLGWRRGDMYDPHLCNGEYLVVHQLLLPQVVVQRGSGPRSIVNNPIGGRSREPLIVVLDESPGEVGPELKTSVAGEPVDRHYAG